MGFDFVVRIYIKILDSILEANADRPHNAE